MCRESKWTIPDELAAAREKAMNTGTPGALIEPPAPAPAAAPAPAPAGPAVPDIMQDPKVVAAANAAAADGALSAAAEAYRARARPAP